LSTELSNSVPQFFISINLQEKAKTWYCLFKHYSFDACTTNSQLTEEFLKVCSLHVKQVHSLTQKFEFYSTMQNPHNLKLHFKVS